ncbi:Fic family protein [Klugiella xanthotipulae]
MLTKSIHGTASIEGNTLSEDEVRQRIDGDLELPQSREYLGTEIDNILSLCNEVMDDVIEGRDQSLSVSRIKHFNKTILKGLPLKPEVEPGKVRTHGVTVGIGHYRGAPAEDCEYLLEEMVAWLNKMRAPDENPELIFPLAVLKSIIAHVYLAWIHPFGDGNGRTARMIEFQLMTEAGVPSTAAHLLSNHYNRTRDAYLVVLDRTSRDPSYPVEDFIQYALQGLVDELQDQIKMIRAQQYEVTWINFVHDMYKDEDTPAKRRQMHLALDMPMGVSVPRGKIREVSPRITAEYAGRESKTVSRDLNELLGRELIVQTKDGFRANRGIIEAFLPIQKKAVE